MMRRMEPIAEQVKVSAMYHRLFDTAAVAVMLVSAATQHAQAQIVLPCPFQDHMMLQAEDKTPFWGDAAAGERIHLSIAGESADVVADSAGKWKTSLDLHRHAGGPYELVIQGNSRIVLADVLIGEVWLASGQSNMELSLAETTNGKEEAANSTDTQLRAFMVKETGSTEPKDTCTGKWASAAPDTTGHFSAVGYYFAKDLRKSLHRPVGLLSAYYGGSDIEAWLSEEAISKLPSVQRTSQPMLQDARSYAARLAQYQADYAAWQAKYHREDTSSPAGPHHDATVMPGEGWKSVDFRHGSFSPPNLPNGGVLWLKESVDVPAVLAGAYYSLYLGTPHAFDEAFWDGHSFGHTTAMDSTSFNGSAAPSSVRRYNVPAERMVAGPATLMVRIFNPIAPPSIDGLALDDPLLKGSWSYRVESTEPPIDEAARKSFPMRPLWPVPERNLPEALFNAMIHPLIPFGIRGIIWYQGEANEGRAWEYRSSFTALIEDWRQQWGQELPFYFCQLANNRPKFKEPKESALAELREAQTYALTLPRTGEEINIDVGEEADVHFRDKKTTGTRLALIALNQTYGQKVEFSGPAYAGARQEGSAMRIRFEHAEGLHATAIPAAYRPKSTLNEEVPLVRHSPGSQLEGFQICGADRHWVWADATIEGHSVLVRSPAVPDPVAVRYAWETNPTVNLYNGSGLPAMPFRTDNFPLSTVDKHF
jgi:sialate O-acetylesterase